MASRDQFSDAAFPCRVDRHRLTRDFIAPHRHEFTELVIVLAGRGRHLTGGREYTICAGDVFVITGERSHSYRDMDGLELVNCLYVPEKILGPAGLLRRVPGYRALFELEPRYRRTRGFRSRLRLGAGELHEVARLVGQMEHEMGSRAGGYEAMVTGYLKQLVTLLARLYSRTRTTASRSLVRVADALGYLESGFNRRIALKDLAARAHMSVNNFLRVFKDATGSSPIRHQIRYRILRAAELLRDEACSVSEAAFAVGFNDSNYFTRQFTRIMGLGPRAFRRQQPGD